MFNTLKSDTESVLGSLKSVAPEFDPSKQSINTILNTVLTDPSAKDLISSTNWKEIIRLGHEKIDQAFSTVSAHYKASPPKQAPTFIEKIQLGLEIIVRGMLEPDSLDPNMPVDDYLKTDPKISTSQFGVQTIGDFLTKITDTFNDQQALKNTFDSSALGKFFPLGKLAFEINRAIINEASTAVSSLLGPEKSRYFVIEGATQKEGLTTIINGMDNTFEEAFRTAAYIQGLDPGNRCIEGIYNHTNSKPVDVVEIFFRNYLGNSPVTQGLLAQKWTDFHEKNKDNPNAKILHFCHSQGAIHTFNALTMLPKEIRDRIIVVAIAPAKIVPRSLCFRSFNYASENDPVPLGELYVEYLLASGKGEAEREDFLLNLPKMQRELIRLKPHDGAKGADHTFQSPTFNKQIKYHLEAYNNGEYQ